MYELGQKVRVEGREEGRDTERQERSLHASRRWLLSIRPMVRPRFFQTAVRSLPVAIHHHHHAQENEKNGQDGGGAEAFAGATQARHDLTCTLEAWERHDGCGVCVCYVGLRVVVRISRAGGTKRLQNGVEWTKRVCR